MRLQNLYLSLDEPTNAYSGTAQFKGTIGSITVNIDPTTAGEIVGLVLEQAQRIAAAVASSIEAAPAPRVGS
jgi:hypothetical protein